MLENHSKFVVEMDEENIDVTSSGQVVSQLAIKVDGNYFPDEKWQDFVQVVLCWWLEAVKDLSTGNKAEVTLDFMDGPFCLVVRKDRSVDLWKLSFVRVSSDKPIILYTSLVDSYEFMMSIIQAANRFIRACIKHGITTEDGKLLEREFKSTQNYLKLLRGSSH